MATGAGAAERMGCVGAACSLGELVPGTDGISFAAIAGLASVVVRSNIAKNSFIVFMEVRLNWADYSVY